MQPSGWELTRASRIVIILLVVHLGLGQILAIASATPAGPDPADPTKTASPADAVLPLAAGAEPDSRSRAARLEHRPTIPPDPAPLPRRLPRAPPAD
jgi:hypothetical protein